MDATEAPNRFASNELFLIQPHYKKNRKYLTSETANFKKAAKTQVKISVIKLSPKGRGPVGRYAHTSSFISQYFIIHGGRNDHIY